MVQLNVYFIWFTKILTKIYLKQIKLDLYPKLNHSPDYGWSFSSWVLPSPFCKMQNVSYLVLSFVFDFLSVYTSSNQVFEILNKCLPWVKKSTQDFF
jgi:hypothetical protein